MLIVQLSWSTRDFGPKSKLLSNARMQSTPFSYNPSPCLSMDYCYWRGCERHNAKLKHGQGPSSYLITFSQARLSHTYQHYILLTPFTYCHHFHYDICTSRNWKRYHKLSKNKFIYEVVIYMWWLFQMNTAFKTYEKIQ